MSTRLKIDNIPEGTFNQFAGAEGEGMSLQITCGSRILLLNEKQVKQLAVHLGHWLPGATTESIVLEEATNNILNVCGPMLKDILKGMLFPGKSPIPATVINHEALGDFGKILKSMQEFQEASAGEPKGHKCRPDASLRKCLVCGKMIKAPKPVLDLTAHRAGDWCYPLIFDFSDGCQLQIHGKDFESDWQVNLLGGLEVTCPHGLFQSLKYG